MHSSRSPRAVMRLAHRLASRHLPDYPSRFSRRDRATQPQLFACLVLRQFYNLSYRRTEALLRDCPDLDAVAYHAWRRAPVTTLVADAGYDSEASHEFLRHDPGVASIIPATIGRPTQKLPTTPSRRLMARAMAESDVKAIYGQRWQARDGEQHDAAELRQRVAGRDARASGA